MAGNHNSGRPSKPLAFHVLHGSYKPSRHGRGGGAPVIAGAVTVPAELAGESLTFWNTVISPLVGLGVVTVSDVPAAQTLCEVWGLMRRAFAALEKDACDKLARVAYTSYSQMFDRLAGKFGLSPSDRQRLKVELPKQQSDFEQFLGSRVASRKRY